MNTAPHREFRTAHLVGGVLVVCAVLVGCAGQSGSGTPGRPSTGPPELSTSSVVPTTPASRRTVAGTAVGLVPGCPFRDTEDAVVPTPAGPTLITVRQGTNAGDPSRPFSVVVYPDGTAIRTEQAAAMSEALPAMTIGWLQPCRVMASASYIVELAHTDLGRTTATDGGTTTVTLAQAAGDVVVQVAGLGVAEDTLRPEQRAARKQLTDLITDLRVEIEQTSGWTPDRLRVVKIGSPTDRVAVAKWPLPGSVEEAFEMRGGEACAVFDGADAVSLRAALGDLPAASGWTDGTQTVVLAIGVLVPGQPGCPAG